MKQDLLFPISFSNSMLETVWLCDMKFFRLYCQRLVGVKRNPDLIAGGHFASACEIVRKAYHNENKSIEESIELGEEYILTGKDTGHAIKTNERLALCLKKYFKTFPMDFGYIPARLSNGSYAIEYAFEFDLGIPHPDFDCNITFKGKLDGLYDEVHLDKTIHRYVLDEKTTGQVSRIPNSKSAISPNGVIDLVKETDNHRMNGQFIGYHWAARELGVRTTGTLVRKIPLLTNHEDAFELTLPIDNFMIQQWYVATVEKIRELVDKYIYYKKNIVGVKGGYAHSVFYPTYQGSCQSFKRLCPMHSGCISKDGEQMLYVTNNQNISVEQENGSRLLVPLKEHIINLEEKYGRRK